MSTETDEKGNNNKAIQKDDEATHKSQLCTV